MISDRAWLRIFRRPVACSPLLHKIKGGVDAFGPGVAHGKKRREPSPDYSVLAFFASPDSLAIPQNKLELA